MSMSVNVKVSVGCSLKEINTKSAMLDFRKNNYFCMYRPSRVTTSKVESDVTGALCVLSSSFMFTGQAGHVLMLVHVNLLFLSAPPLRTPLDANDNIVN